jgi:bifunctional DNA-binding transcriptional regulator/antitoxin component of YhaV-PrlF toxin-antitoxin module
MPIVKTTSRRQVTFRKEIFEHVGIKPGEKLEIDMLPGGEIRGRAVRKKHSISEFAGCLKGKTNGARLSIEQINDAIADAAAEAGMAGLKR